MRAQRNAGREDDCARLLAEWAARPPRFESSAFRHRLSAVGPRSAVNPRSASVGRGLFFVYGAFNTTVPLSESVHFLCIGCIGECRQNAENSQDSPKNQRFPVGQRWTAFAQVGGLPIVCRRFESCRPDHAKSQVRSSRLFKLRITCAYSVHRNHAQASETALVTLSRSAWM